MKKSIFFKSFASYLALSLAVSLLLFLFLAQAANRQLLDSTETHLRHLAEALRLPLAGQPVAETAKQLQKTLTELDRSIEARVTVVAPDGSVIADSESDPAIMENHLDRPEIAWALTGEAGKSVRFSSTLHQQMMYYAIPVPAGGKIVAALRVSLSVRTIDQALQKTKTGILRIALLLFLLSLLPAFLFSRHLSHPIRRLAQTAQRVAAGDLQTRARLKNRDELGELGRCFDEMVERQKSLVESLSLRQQELETILASIREGLVVIDGGEKIAMANASFRRLSGRDDALGKSYWEVIRDPHFHEIVKDSASDKPAEVEINGRQYLVGRAPLKSDGSAVLVLHDITEHKRLEQIKKDFVANISHELRTPLTAIKGFVETIEEEEPGRNRRYLEIIKRHTERLIALVSDLLTLSALEERGARLQREPVDLRRLAGDILKIFGKKAQGKNLRLTLATPEGERCVVCGDPSQLEQLLINLVDNALKYTERGEIRVSLERSGDQVVMRVEDSGPGIAAEHLPRIFERFYVVDKSRSRRLGGTGLGLAIVKHIVSLHQGSIEVASELDRGTTFTVILPAV